MDEAEWLQKQAAVTGFYRKVRFSVFPLLFRNQLLTLFSPEWLLSHRSHPIPCLLPGPIPPLTQTRHRKTPSVDFESTNPIALNFSAAEIRMQYRLHYTFATTKTPRLSLLRTTLTGHAHA